MKKNYLCNFILLFCVFKITNCELICEKIYSYEVCKEKLTNQLKSVKQINITSNTTDGILLHINKISSIGSRAFENQKILRGLTIIGSDFFFDLHPNSFVGLEKLKTLEIFKTLVKLDEIIFRPLESLEYLSLSVQGNSKELENKLSHLRSLKGLAIFYSFLNKINAKTFNSLTRNIKRLSLINCNISLIEPLSFWTLKNLELLILNNNKLTILKPGTFNDLKKLKHLSIASNNIKQIESHIFNELTSLSILDLDFNVIEKIDKNAFTYTAIEKLFLQDNALAVIETGIFNSINRTLQEIHLQNNRIHLIQKNVFFGMNLSMLNLRDNNLRVISRDSFGKISIKNLFLESDKNDFDEIEKDAFKDATIHRIFISKRGNIIGNASSWGLGDSTLVFS